MMETAARKAWIRRLLLRRRESLSEWTRAQWASRIQEHLLSLPGVARARWIHFYAAVRGEVPTREMMWACLARGMRVVVPRVDPQGRRLEFSEIRDPDRDLIPGFRGILEPPPTRFRPVSPEVLEVVVLPGVGFDLQGHRLGYGGGFYDRLLATLLPRPLCIGLAYSLQVVPALPREDHDVRMDWVVTEIQALPTRRGFKEEQEDHARKDH